jgi:hypothetical protein
MAAVFPMMMDANPVAFAVMMVRSREGGSNGAERNGGDSQRQDNFFHGSSINIGGETNFNSVLYYKMINARSFRCACCR